jgi:hypothetical protein
MFFKVGVSIPQGNGESRTAETIVELEKEDAGKLTDVLWNLLDSVGVESWWEETKEPKREE